MDKAPDAFRTISEVADELDVPQHVLRFWETRFAQIKPMKRGGGRRYYRPDDVDLLRGIRHLLYGEGYTIRGVQRLLKDNGAKFVQGVWVTENAQGIALASSNAVAEVEVDEDDDADVAENNDDGAESDAKPVRQEPSFAAPTRDSRVTLTRTNPVAPVAVAELAKSAPLAPSQKPAPPHSLSAEDRRKLEAALFELGECRRLLDLALKE